MIIWGILTLALCIVMMRSEHWHRETDSHGTANNDAAEAIALLLTSAAFTAPLALAWWAAKAILMTVVRWRP